MLYVGTPRLYTDWLGVVGGNSEGRWTPHDSRRGNDGLHFNHRRRAATRKERAASVDARLGVFRINWYPLGRFYTPFVRLDDTHHPRSTPSPSFGRAFSTHAATQLGLAEKTRRNFFIDSTGKLIFYSFFLLPLSPVLRSGSVRGVFFFIFALPLHLWRIVSRHRDFFSHRTLGGNGSPRGGPRVKSPRAERARAATKPINYQNNTGFFTRRFVFILSFFVVFLIFISVYPRGPRASI